MRCGEVNPAGGDRACVKTGRHGHHNDGTDEPDAAWKNGEFVPRVVPKGKAPKRKDSVRMMADFLKTNARTDDPDSSHEAAERYEPKQGTAQARVLEYLRARPNQWVDAPDLTAPEVGGFAGTRRLRELREGGWMIETRPKPGEMNLWQHRLVDPPTE